MKLYEINEKLNSILENMCDMETGEIDPVMVDELACIQIDRNTKILDTACYIRGLEAEAEAVAAEAKKLQARKKSLENKADWVHGYLVREMQPEEKLKDSRVSLSWRHSKYVEITCEQSVPNSFKVVKTEVSKALLSDALKAGGVIEGAELRERVHLVIK
jgi:hypothetical protein